MRQAFRDLPELQGGVGLDGIVPFDPAAAPSYPAGQLVTYNGSLYIADVAAPTGTPDTSPDYTLLAVAGATGVTGPTGLAGATGTTVTATSLNAVNTGGSVYAVVLGETNIALPTRNIGGGITANAGNTVFTVPTTGRYYITYQVNITAALLVSTRLVINGAGNLASTIAPVVGLTSFNNDVIVPLNAGSTISLQFFGLIGLATLIAGGAGATLTIIRVE
ncbi:BclA C-terminal domain-containing protein [Priestia endophytica]|uniref:BclA C-terminal domain-containing protein n=1 Tax=Priestia endophytica TaxID=135735 RepID=UPI000DCA635E|nr:hypothetical protein A4U60_22155 [Priestia endophytica]